MAKSNKASLKLLWSFDPTPEDIFNACMSYRHDYGLMSPEEQQNLEFAAKEWLRAWRHTLENKGVAHAES